MKKIFLYTFYLFTATLILVACKEESNYPGGSVSPYIPLYDLRNIYKGTDVTLTKDVMFGSNKIAGIVVSDHAEGNMPEGQLIVQDRRRLQQLRGISIPIGAEAANYVSGDSVHIEITGGVLKRINGVLQITGVPASAVTKVSSGNPIAPNRVPSRDILSDPSRYESTLVAIVKGSFDPIPTPSDKFAGDKVVNDGFDNITMRTEASAAFANNPLPVSANFYGVIFNDAPNDTTLVPRLQIRKAADVQVLSSTIELTPIIITGYIANPDGSDDNNEYMQFMATRDINFAVTPFSVVTTNNAGATNPTGFPSLGWATGSLAKSGSSRTYKFNLTSGTVLKGEFFYVGGSNKKINGSSSITSLASSKWIRSFNYSSTNGDGFGLKTGNLFANSGNASGFAVFEGTTVTKDSKPIDVIMIDDGGSIFSESENEGYRIANTDYYDVINPITLVPQPFYKQGSNTINLIYVGDQGNFVKLGGIYNARLGKWVQARSQTNIDLTAESTLEEIEGVFPLGTTPEDPGGQPTKLVN